MSKKDFYKSENFNFTMVKVSYDEYIDEFSSPKVFVSFTKE